MQVTDSLGKHSATIVDNGDGTYSLKVGATFSGSLTTSDPTNIGDAGATSPTRVALVGFTDDAGKLQPASIANPFPVTGGGGGGAVTQGTNPWLDFITNDGGSPVPITGTLTCNAGTGTFTVGGTVTSNIGTTGGLALDTSVNGVLLAQSSTTSGQTGPLCQGAVTTAAPTYTTAKTSPLSLDTAGNLRASVTGTVTSNQGTYANPTNKAYANATNAGVIKAGAGNLFGICVFDYGTSAPDLLMLFNQTTTPTNGATPVFAFGLQQGGTTGPGWVCIDTTTFTLAGMPFGTGIAWAVSTSRGTLTLATAANIDFGGAEYQ